MKTLLQQHDDYVARVKASGAPTRTYRTPCCGKELEDPVPHEPGDQWDSLTQCPHCNALYMKVARADAIYGFVPDME